MALRTEELLDVIMPVMGEREPHVREELAAIFTKTKAEFGQAFLQAIEECESQAKSRREAGRKGETELICVSFLLSGLLNSKWELQVSVHDRRSLLDDTDCTAELAYTPIGRMFEQEIALCYDTLKPLVSNLQAYEVAVLRHELAYLPYGWVKAYLLWLVDDMVFVEGLAKLPMPMLTEISYGYYLNDQECLFSIMRSDAE